MLHRDYFMRLVEKLAAVLAKILFLKEQNKYDEVIEYIRENSKLLVGVDFEMISRFSEHDILGLFNLNEVSNAGRFVVLAGLLREEGEAYENLGNTAGAVSSYTKSLVFYAEALKFGDVVAADVYIPKVEFVIEKIKDYELSETGKLELIKYYELAGSYDKAEDLIFAEKDSRAVLSAGLSFYKKLLLKSDEEILKGGLSREEAKDALGELLRLRGPD